MNIKPLYTVRELSDICGVSRHTMRIWLQKLGIYEPFQRIPLAAIAASWPDLYKSLEILDKWDVGGV